jgi:hypothetical protein
MKNGPKSSSLWAGNQLDSALRTLNDGQTHGIPIGPDVSLLVAEVLLAAADQELLTECAGLVHGFRYVDDYELAFRKLSDAEKVLTELQGILAKYELTLNPRKTRFEELPRPLETSWAAELSRFPLRDMKSRSGQRNDITSLFSRAFEMAAQHPEDGVLKYAIARVRNENIQAGGWRSFQNCVLAEVFESIIDTHARRQEGSEVAWALWGSLAWGVHLSSECGKILGDVDDDIVALLALDAEARGLLPKGSLNKQQWVTVAEQPDVLKSEHWLLAYEGTRNSWLDSPAVASEKDFASMAKAGIGFYDPAQNSPQYPAAAARLPGGTLEDHYA